MLSFLLTIFNFFVMVLALNSANPVLTNHEHLPVPDQSLYCVVPKEYIMDAQDFDPELLPAEIKGPYSFFTQLNLPSDPDRVEITDYGSINAGQV